MAVSALLDAPPASRQTPTVPLEASAKTLGVSVESLLAGLQTFLAPDRRATTRVQVSQKLELILLDEDLQALDSPALEVECIEISEHGVRFRHEQLFQARSVGLTVPGSDCLFVTRVKWSRFTRDGYYESGGAFVRVVSTTKER